MSGILLAGDTETDSPEFRELRRTWGFALENPEAQFVSLSVAEEIALTLASHGRQVSENAVFDALNRFGISALSRRGPQQLSEGEKHRVTLAAIELAQPCVMLLDDPTATLDNEGRGIFLEMISREKQRGTTIVFSSHDMEVAASAMRYLGLRKGSIAANRRISNAIGAICDADVFPELKVNISSPPARKSFVGVDDFVLQARNISFSFSRDRSLFSDINIELRPSDVLMVRGANGSGKTTLLHLLAGLRQPQLGSISICGLKLHEIPMDRRSEFCSLAFQNPEHQLFLEKVGDEIVSAVPPSKRTTSDVITAREWMKSCVSVSEDSRDPHSLSLGQKKIVTLLTAIISNPRLLLLDEPELGLDLLQKERVAQMLEMIRTHWRTAMVIVTHDQTFMRHLGNVGMLDL